MRIAAVGDIHVRKGDKGRFASCFTQISSEADVLVICGDLTDTGSEAEAVVLAEELRSCKVPVVAVLGNHDHEKGKPAEVRRIMKDAGVHMLDGEAVVINGVGFAGTKGFGGGFDKYSLSMFGETAMKAFVQEAVDEALKLDRALTNLDKEHNDIPKIAVMHYSPIKDTIMGEPEVIFPFLGSSRLAEPLIRRQVAAAFHGHAHAGTLESALNDVRVFNVALPILHKSGHTCGYYVLDLQAAK